MRVTSLGLEAYVPLSAGDRLDRSLARAISATQPSRATPLPICHRHPVQLTDPLGIGTGLRIRIAITAAAAGRAHGRVVAPGGGHRGRAWDGNEEGDA